MESFSTTDDVTLDDDVTKLCSRCFVEFVIIADESSLGILLPVFADVDKVSCKGNGNSCLCKAAGSAWSVTKLLWLTCLEWFSLKTGLFFHSTLAIWCEVARPSVTACLGEVSAVSERFLPVRLTELYT